VFKYITFILLAVSSNVLQAEEIHSHEEGNNTTIKIKSVRGVLGANNPIAHTHAQIRAGYITLKEENTPRTNAYALGGHVHFDTKRWYGLEVGLSAYTVLNLGKGQNNTNLNPDFFDADGNSFVQLTEAYLDGKWGETEIKFGRQILDTPHADSDDIRMISNYFEAYTLTNESIEDLTLSVGYISKMAGWENGVDAKKFVNISEVLGTDATDGVYFTSASYDGIKDLSLSLWVYHFTDIADVLYTEVGYEAHVSNMLDIIIGLQYDTSKETGSALLQQQDANTYGISAEFVSEEIGIHILTAYNKDTGETGASSLNLGGGALFTSMEDQTLDALGEAGEAWILGAGYHFSTMGINGLNAGVAYGKFTADNTSDYTSEELDVVVEYQINKQLSFTLAYADVSLSTGLDENNQPLQDYSQVRVIGNYNF